MRSDDREKVVGELPKTKDFCSLEDEVGEIIFLATGSDSKGGNN